VQCPPILTLSSPSLLAQSFVIATTNLAIGALRVSTLTGELLPSPLLGNGPGCSRVLPAFASQGCFQIFVLPSLGGLLTCLPIVY
jgi:hypothetical protein